MNRLSTFVNLRHCINRCSQAPPPRSIQVAQEFIGDESTWFALLVKGATERALGKTRP